MALSKTITKIFPTKSHVGMHLVLKDDNRPGLGDGPQVVIDRDFTENFTKSRGATDAVRDSLGRQIQEAIDDYKELADMYRSSKYETVRTQIDNNLQL